MSLNLSFGFILFPILTYDIINISSGKRFRPGPVPQLHRAANQLLELGFRAFGIVLSASVMVPMIFRSLTPDQVYQDRKIYLNALYNKGYEHYGANVTLLNNTAENCTPNPYDDCDR